MDRGDECCPDGGGGVAVVRVTEAVRAESVAGLDMLPVTEDSDEGGAGDADVGVRESPAVVVCGGALWGWCRWLWVRCRGYVSVTSVTAERAAASSTMALPAA